MSEEKPKKRRLTKDEMEERLEQVYDLRLRGLSFSVIGKMLDPQIDKSMVCRDLQRLRKRFKKTVRDYDPEADVGADLEFFKKIETSAFMEYTGTRTANTKAGFLNTALRARELAIKLKMEFGLMRRVPQEFALKMYDKFDESEYPSDGGS